MKARFLSLNIVTLLIVGSPTVADEKSDWKQLLPKEGWKEIWHTEGNWKMDDDGVLTLVPREGEKGWSRWGSYLWSHKQYDNFEIMFDYKTPKGSNSGFYFNVGDKNSPVAKGVEVQIYASYGKDPNRLTDHDSGGIIPGVPPTKNAAKPHDEWNTFHITVKDNKVTVLLNGELVNDVSLDQGALKSRPKSGYIGFQDHALPLSLRNIKIREH